MKPNVKGVWSACRVNCSWLMGLATLASLCACVSPPVVLTREVGPQPAPGSLALSGHLVVYSATYAPVLEQSEYPVHTDYTVASLDDRPIQRVGNGTGPFDSYPAKVSLPAGEYHVRAQYAGGGFVVIPVVIEPFKTTVVDLDSEAVPQQADTSNMVRLPDGHVVGWRATSPSSSP